MKPGGSRGAGRRNTVQHLDPGAVAAAAAEPMEDVAPGTAVPHTELLPFVRLHACHPESKTAPLPLLEAQVMDAMALPGRPESNKKYRLAVRGHYFLVLDDTGSRVPLTDADLLGLEIISKPGSEGIPPLIALKVAQPQEMPVPVKPPDKAPSPSAPMATEIHKARKVTAPETAWLLVAEGGEECLHRAAATLTGAGALRTDFEAAYHMEDGVVGSGAFGSVHRARAKNSKGEKERSGEPLVVKCIEPEAFADGSSAKGPPEAIPKLLRSEMSFMLTAKGHPHILALHAVFRTENRQWILVMDFCAGGDAFGHIAKTGVQTEASCRILTDGLLSALSHLAGLRILHRDVKPENLLLQTGGRPVLCDFGLACHETDAEECKRRVGSPGYIAPEVLLGSPCAHKADVFAAGGTLHFAITGSAPFVGKDMAVTLHKTMNEEVYYNGVDNVGDECKNFALLLLNKTPEERPTAQEALRNAWFGRRSADVSISASLPMPGRGAAASGKRKAATVKVDPSSIVAEMPMGKTFSRTSADGGAVRPSSSMRKGRGIPRSADDRGR